MKHLVFLTFLFLAVFNPAIAQTQSPDRKSTEWPASKEAVTIRSGVIDDLTIANQARESATETQRTTGDSASIWGDMAVPGVSRRTDSSATDQQRKQTTRLIQQTSMPIEASAVSPFGSSSGASVSAPGPAPPNSIYRVGVGDVLDIRLLDLPNRESTLFTVLKGGIIEYPLIAEPLKVEGLRTPEIALVLAGEIRVIQGPRVVVTVRDYASHVVTVTGSVESPGSKILRREAMPAFAILAEAVPRSEASNITITRADGKVETFSISDSQAMSSLVFSGDAIKVSNKPPIAKRFLYVGGDVTSPGEKEYREGVTLTQLLLASGGTLRTANIATVARPTANGFLTSTQYDLSMVKQGQIPDPVLEPGDRIEVLPRTP